MGNGQLTGRAFDSLVKATGIEAVSIRACKRVLVDGLSINAAAREADLSPSTVSRMLRKIPTELCGCCGQPLNKEPPI